MAYVTPAINSNVVIAPRPDTPGVYSRYASGQSTALGWIQVAVGIIVVIASTIWLSTVENTLIIGDLFTGVLLISAGACGIGAGKYKTNPPIVGFMVLSIFASIVATIAFFVWTAAIKKIPHKYHDTGYVDVATAMAYIFIFAYLTESIVSIWSAAICCNVACCGRRQGADVLAALILAGLSTLACTKWKHIKVGGAKVFDTETIYARAISLQSSARDLYTTTLMGYELSPIPMSMFDENGNMGDAKTKSNLKIALKVEVSRRPAEQDVQATFLDGCAVLWVVPWPISLHDYFVRVRSYIHGHLAKSDVYLVFDRYIEGWDKGLNRVYTLGCTARLPPQKVVLTITTNKDQLIALIVEDLVSHKADFQKHKLVVTGRDPVPVEITNGGQTCQNESGKYVLHDEVEEDRCLESCSAKQTQHPWPHISRNEDRDGLGTCVECHQAHCQGHPCAGQRMVERDVVARKKYRPKRTVEKEMKECGLTLDTVTNRAADRQQ
ncbi:hypothetical protein LSAT2_008387 [Lamellibrachia satsuma]|nr:hypothetical protein LSAT2_008387 [Lamellibrachia satsuma]